MRSISGRNINLLPQWSDPINVTLEVLPPLPEITTHLLYFNLHFTPQGRYLEAVINLTWVEPEGEREGFIYEVWVGSVPLEGYEEPDLYRQPGQIVPLEVKSL